MIPTLCGKRRRHRILGVHTAAHENNDAGTRPKLDRYFHHRVRESQVATADAAKPSVSKAPLEGTTATAVPLAAQTQAAQQGAIIVAREWASGRGSFQTAR